MHGKHLRSSWLVGAWLLAGCGGAKQLQPPPCVDSAPAPSAQAPAASDSVCKFGGGAALPAPGADGAVAVAASHPFVSYLGRVDCRASGGPMLGFVGASVRVRFVGTGLDLRLKDFGGGTPQTTNYYDVSIDGAPPQPLEVSPARELYPLAANLSAGEHRVEIFKRIESAPGGSVGAGKAQVLGFVLHGKQLLPVALPGRRLEFIGDSITVGYGDEVSTMDPANAHYTTLGSNGHKAFGAVTAALLGARYMAVAYSGRGVSRNYAGSGGQLLPEMYLQSVPEEPSAGAWDPAQYTPDAVIINLGSNDFSTPGVDRVAFVDGYITFLTKLRGYYPKAMFVAALGPMLSDVYPPGENAWTNAQADLKAAVDARKRAGDGRIEILLFATQEGPWGEDWHPTVATHEKMAQELSARLQTLMGW